MSYHRKALGSTQSRPSFYARVPRAVDGYDVDVRVGGPRGRARVQTSLGSTQSRPSLYTRVPHGFGSLGDATDQEPATSLSQPSTSSPTILDPATVQWQGDMLAQTKMIAAAQQDFTQREVKARYLQIAATLAIPLAAAAWRAIGRVLSGRREERDFE